MELTPLQLVDYFFRFAAIGQLTLLSVNLYKFSRVLDSLLLVCLLTGLSGYLVLTSPEVDVLFPYLRGPALFLTELTPYVLWLYTFNLISDRFKSGSLPIWAKLIIGIILVWYGYVFIFLSGAHLFHDVNTALALGILVHTVYLAGRDFTDDLINRRRNIRKSIIVCIGLFFMVLVFAELRIIQIKEHAGFSLLTSGIIFVTVFVIGTLYLNYAQATEVVPAVAENENGETKEQLPLAYQTPYENLKQLMESQYYTEADITIVRLANKLDFPEHQLRELINQHLGYKNFSTYLNSYRIPEACRRLHDIKFARSSITTIAYDLGYGSIGPFNRAFKTQMGCTPREFRQQIQN